MGRENGDHNGQPLAAADATVDDKGAVIWEWNFERLKAFLENERETSNALSAYINYDLRAKLINTGVSMSDFEFVDEGNKGANREKRLPSQVSRTSNGSTT